MASADGYIRIDTKLNTSGMESGMSRISSSLSRLAGAVGVAFGAKAVIDFGKQCLESAASVKAAGSQFEQTFGSMADQAEAAIGRVADSAGIMDTRLQGVGTSIYAFAKTTGMDSSEALGMMERALNATADSAAYYDRSLEDTAESLKSFLKGNFENDAALGLSCTETTRNAAANKLYGKSFQELSESQKQLTLLQMVEDANALSGALGQAARESDGWENVTGNLSESLRQLMAVIGQPILSAAVPIVQSLTAGMQELTGMVQAGYDAISAWVRTVDFGPLLHSVQELKKALGELWRSVEGYIQALSKTVKPLLKWLIETALPAFLNLLGKVAAVMRTIFDLAVTGINLFLGGISTVINGVKAVIAAVMRLFGMEPPDWVLQKTDLTIDTSGVDNAGDAVDDLTGSYDELGEAADDAADAIEEADKAGGGSGGGSGSKAQRDVLGFDQITKLSQSSGSGGSGGGSGGSGGGDGGSSGSGEGGNPASTFTDPKIKSGAEQLGDTIDGLRIEFDDLNISIDKTARKLQELGKNRSATITLNLQKGKDFDDLKAQWDAIQDSSVLKELKATLEAAIRAAIQLTVQQTTQPQSGGRGGGFGSGHGGGFGRGGGFEGGNGGSLSGTTSKSSTSILDTVKKWWDSLKKGKATKTLDLKGGSFGGGGGGFSKGVKQWESLKDGKATKTLDGKVTGKYTVYQKDWVKWVSGTITKTADGKQSAKYTSYQKDWRSWISGTITKTADGAQSSKYTSYQRDWRSWGSGTITKTADGSRTRAYTSYRDAWTAWGSQTVTKTAEASPGRRFYSIKSDWDSLKNKKVTGDISLRATVSNIKDWMNSNVITPLNRTIHKVFPGISIPKLARGGVVNQATMALIGEAGREAVMPLDRNTGWMDELAGRLAQQLGGTAQGGELVVEVHVGNELLTRKVVQGINDTTRQTGRCPIYL